PGPGGDCDPRGAPLHPARHAPLRRAGHGARLAVLLQYARRDRIPCPRRAEGAEGVRLMSELAELYQQVILDHNRNPRNFRPVASPTARAEGFNPVCGDHFTLAVTMEADRIADAAFQGSGCAISKASASMMTEAVRGLPRAQAERLADRFQ